MLPSLLTSGLILFADNSGDPAPIWTGGQILLMVAPALAAGVVLSLLVLRRAVSVLRRAPRPERAKTAPLDGVFPECKPPTSAGEPQYSQRSFYP